MKIKLIPFLAMMAAPLVGQAEVSLNGARVGAVDTVATAAFYEQALGMHEVGRIPLPSGAQILLDFGATVEDARANRNTDVVIRPRETDDTGDTMSHLVFTVSDIEATVASVKAAGGTMQQEPTAFGDSGVIVAMGVDPAGNLFELIQFSH